MHAHPLRASQSPPTRLLCCPPPTTLPAGAAELLDPLLPLLVRALRSRHAPSVTAALSSLSLLVQSRLLGLDQTAAGGCRREGLEAGEGRDAHFPARLLTRRPAPPAAAVPAQTRARP